MRRRRVERILRVGGVMKKNTEHRAVGERPSTEMLPGIFRTTLCYDDTMMICHFTFKKGATIALHNHLAAQSGYVVRGRVRFFKQDGSEFHAGPGTGYYFSSNELHGGEAIEESEVVECFAPMRPEYADQAHAV